MELITGKTGEQHVYAADDAAIYKMMVGSGDYVLPLGNQLAARMNGTTELIVSDGLLITQGRLARTRASSGEDHLQIANGVDGQRRADLIVAEYSQYDSDIEGVSTTLEKMELKVIQGAYSTTEWKTPAHTTGDIDAGRTHQVPLWEVRLDGINFNSLIDHRVMLNPVIDTVQNNITTIQSNLLNMAHDMAAGIKSRINGCYRDTQSGDGTAITSKVFHLTGYQYKSADIFMVYMNGLLMRDDEISSIASDAGNVIVTFASQITMTSDDKIELVVLAGGE